MDEILIRERPEENRGIVQEEPKLPVDAERLRDFDRVLQKYKNGKKNLERRVVAAEQWWKLRNEAEERKQNIGWDDKFRAKSGWLHNVIVSKHADAMENYPEPLVLPREINDREMAKTLSDVLPVILEQNKFEKTYSDTWWQKLKTGTGVYKITWDDEKLNGLGDINIERVDLLSVFWEPGITDIQKSRYFFHVELHDNDELEGRYPQLKDKLKGDRFVLTKFLYDDNVDTTDKTAVIDVYYKVQEGERTVLHYCKYVNDIVLDSTENDEAGTGRSFDSLPLAQDDTIGDTQTGVYQPQNEGWTGGRSFGSGADLAQDDTEPAPVGQPGTEVGQLPMPGMAQPNPLGPVEPEHRGLYDHGKFPFVFDVLWPIEGSPCGYGYVDLCMNTQIQLDMMDTAFLKNTMVGAMPRYFSRVDGNVNEAEFLDINKPIVHVAGSLMDDTTLRQIGFNPIAGNYISFREQNVTELRETSGNTESANGIYSGGVTAASSIAALQEASGKTSRDASKASYRSFGEMQDMIIELVRQFYTLPRTFRITGEGGQQQFVTMDNSMMQPQWLGMIGQEDMGFRLPVFDVKVEIQKKNAYTRTSQNELALQLFNLGFFNPQYATPATQCLDMMDFDGKDELMQKLQQNGGLFQQLQTVSQYLLAMAQKYEPQNAQALAQQLGMGMAPAGGGGAGPIKLGQAPNTGENRIVANARAKSNQAASPEA